jgi:low temperature requirement protein LtrA
VFSGIIGRFELFLDLLFVAILANFAEELASNASGDQLVKYLVRLSILLFPDSEKKLWQW